MHADSILLTVPLSRARVGIRVFVRCSVMMPHMTAWEAYEYYKIMPNLRLHQQRVAAVARVLALALGADVDRCTKAGLLHDMGNIMKTDFTQFPPDFYGEKGIAYWQDVQEATARFGADEHSATAAIVRDMGSDPAVIDLIDAMGFSRAREILDRGSLELKIIEYADQRVAPYGITSMKDRLQEGRERYAKRRIEAFGENDEAFEYSARALEELEGELFSGITLKPSDLNDTELAEMVSELRDYEVA